MSLSLCLTLQLRRWTGVSAGNVCARRSAAASVAIPLTDGLIAKAEGLIATAEGLIAKESGLIAKAEDGRRAGGGARRRAEAGAANACENTRKRRIGKNEDGAINARD